MTNRMTHSWLFAFNWDEQATILIPLTFDEIFVTHYLLVNILFDCKPRGPLLVSRIDTSSAVIPTNAFFALSHRGTRHSRIG
jgi:hypothetical protein